MDEYMLGAKELRKVERISLQMFPTDLTPTEWIPKSWCSNREIPGYNLCLNSGKKIVRNLMIEAVWAFLQQWAVNVNMDCDLFRDTGSWLFNIHEMQPCTLSSPKHKMIKWRRNLSNLYLTLLESLSSIVHSLRVGNIHCILRIFISVLLVPVNQPPPNSWPG